MDARRIPSRRMCKMADDPADKLAEQGILPTYSQHFTHFAASAYFVQKRQQACYPLGAPTSLGLAPWVQLQHTLVHHPRVHQCITPAPALAFTTLETVPVYNTALAHRTLTPNPVPMSASAMQWASSFEYPVCSLPAVAILTRWPTTVHSTLVVCFPLLVSAAVADSLCSQTLWPCSPATPHLVTPCCPEQDPPTAAGARQQLVRRPTPRPNSSVRGHALSPCDPVASFTGSPVDVTGPLLEVNSLTGVPRRVATSQACRNDSLMGSPGQGNPSREQSLWVITIKPKYI
ncbi:hypothetical protein B0H10DRAFT_2210384 [Mycena sp. CBHHK59/15]|nr:hypothetical protein B0H10DRAFT_2210384 [Mycena sp. CBHHK59/15]